MLIDFHTHVFPDKIAQSTVTALQSNSGTPAFTDGTVNGLVNEMQRGGADICVTLPVLTKPTQFDSVTRFILEINEKFEKESKRLISFGGMHPDCDNIRDKMKFLKENGVKGVKIHPDYQRTYIDDEKYYEILCAAKDYDMIVVTHAGVDYGYKNEPVRCSPELTEKVLKRINYDKIVLAHYGAHLQWDGVLDRLADFGCYFDTAFTFHEIKRERFIAILNKHGADRILFATDCPWRGIKEDKEIFASYDLSKEVYDKIFYKNALKLLNLEEDYAM